MRTRAALTTLLGVVAALAVTVTTAPTASATDMASNGYPYCVNASSADANGDGWGWENNQSCIVRGGKADPGPAAAATAPNGYPYCVNASSADANGDGWGWENNHSCVVRGGKADTGSSSGSSSGSGSTACPSGMTCGSYTVSGLGSRKGQVAAAGGNTLDLAVAMLETDTMTATYAYGDNKSGDAANFGIFKQNWMMLRAACSQFSGQSADQYNNGAALNGNLGQDVSCLHQSQGHYGLSAWFAGHRDGSSGLADPNTADITNYRTAVYWIKAQLDANSANLSNDTRFWVQVPAI
ncbi:carbohydrate-binding domain-containing protein [Kitasatospora sp. NPDC058965]|uniref:carbohydrate-binding domain-containing protein n=1 Tax=Kitasatospora sp. NPDC058965 TaxID=3346682 RepID=UPI0036894760